MSLVVADIGVGNTASMVLALERLGAGPRLSGEAACIAEAERLIFPGVGAAGFAAARIEDLGLNDVLRRFDRPLLGVCLGMQLLFERSEEGDTAGLGVLPGKVVRFEQQAMQQGGLKVPHMGWNRVHQCTSHPMWEGIVQDDFFYFVHSYHVVPADPAIETGRTHYGVGFTCAVAQANIFATQFHPEKSAASGLRLYENFIHWQP